MISNNPTGILIVHATGLDESKTATYQAIAQRYRAQNPGAIIEVCVLSAPGITLGQALTNLQEHKVAAVRIIAPEHDSDRTRISWIRRIAKHWYVQQENPPSIAVYTSKIQESALLAAIEDADSQPDSRKTQTVTTAAPLLSPAWEKVPNFTRHVLICRDPRCSALGADATASALAEEYARLGLSDDEVLITQTGCLFPCSLGPVMAVYPEGIWYEYVDEKLVRRIVTQHLCDDTPLVEHCARDLNA
ncbi:ferredoxin [Corynebacterium kutscheri]|uniref:Ferredoxin n=1 Tax=Corynebacterium kutscheri TaxID=35755 RepID=A0A0F6TDE6_9CORY|nr:(2Fe-2S) ferredoxin domain-containing protein [Corynebacterium kutscheri]AKE41114.1 ferredoxin [Corynebacterium kutscheri]VEH09432.1 NADH:ubiquinone oxidoreductase [Corynebacterium kutscheri]